MERKGYRIVLLLYYNYPRSDRSMILMDESLLVLFEESLDAPPNTSIRIESYISHPISLPIPIPILHQPSNGPPACSFQSTKRQPCILPSHLVHLASFLLSSAFHSGRTLTLPPLIWSSAYSLRAFGALFQEDVVELSSLRRLAARGQSLTTSLARTVSHRPTKQPGPIRTSTHSFVTLFVAQLTLLTCTYALSATPLLIPTGIPSHPPHLRPLTYSVLLGVLGKETASWPKERAASRLRYSTLCSTFLAQVDEASVSLCNLCHAHLYML